MSGLTFQLKTAPAERLDLSPLTPSKLANMALTEMLGTVIGSTKRRLTVGDVFTVSGQPGDTVTIAGGTERLDFIGGGLDKGTLIVEGNAGICAGRGMSGGRLEIRGSAGPWLGASLKGGLISVKGSAGGHVGGWRAGESFGMIGGTVVIDGDAGARVGDRMRRGTIIIKGRCGTYAGSRMLGGTILAEQGFGAKPGVLLRRGTLIGSTAEEMLPTYADSGKHDLAILNILSKYLADSLGPLAPAPIPSTVRKFAGDLAAIGKGEILLTA